MPITRRVFSIGAGALITAAFVSKAAGHLEITGRPLLVSPPRIEGELFVDMDGYISLGRWLEIEDVPVMTWRECLTRFDGARFDSAKDEQFWSDHVHPDALDGPMNEESWWHAWYANVCPAAQAFRLLDKLDIGPLEARWDEEDDDDERASLPALEFVDGPQPGDSSRYVLAKTPMSVALLQARLVELGTGLKVHAPENFSGSW